MSRVPRACCSLWLTLMRLCCALAVLARQTVTPTATKSGDAVSATLAAKYSLMPWLVGEATFGTSGSVALNCEATDALAKGLMITAECEKAAPGKPGLLQAANFIVDYKQDMFTCKTSFDYYKADLLGAPAGLTERTRAFAHAPLPTLLAFPP